MGSFRRPDGCFCNILVNIAITVSRDDLPDDLSRLFHSLAISNPVLDADSEIVPRGPVDIVLGITHMDHWGSCGPGWFHIKGKLPWTVGMQRIPSKPYRTQASGLLSLFTEYFKRLHLAQRSTMDGKAACSTIRHLKQCKLTPQPHEH